MWKFIAALLYTFITISNAKESNSSLLENRALPARIGGYIGKEVFKYVVSLGVFKDGKYIHICLAVMVTGLVGITSGKCGDYDYYAEIAELTEIEKNLTEEKRTKLHVNTKRPIHSHPDMFYTVTRFIDFDKYLFHKRGNKIFVPLPDIGVFVLNKEVRYRRPAPNVANSIIKVLPLPTFTRITLIGMNTMERISEENMLMKKNIRMLDYFYYENAKAYLKLSQYHVSNKCYDTNIVLQKDDLGGPVYWDNQFLGILVDEKYAIVAIDAILQKHIDEIIDSTSMSQMEECEIRKRKRDVSTSSDTTS